MRVLLLTPDAPVPVHVNGGVTRQYHLHRRLIELGHEVTVVGVMPPHVDDQTAALEAEGFVIHPLVRPRSRAIEVLRAVFRRPSILRGLVSDPVEDLVTRIYWVDLRSIVREVLADQTFDVICVECGYAAHWLSEIDTETPTVLTSHEVKSPEFARKAAKLKGLRGLVMRENARRQRRSEERWSLLPDAIIAMSEREIEIWREVVPNLPPAYAVGNGADFSEFEQIGEPSGEPRVLFTGTLAYSPNAAAAEWLARRVWPLVRKEVPQAKLDIVGRAPNAATLTLGDLDGVAVHADVPTMVPFFEAAAVCALPMTEGGGTRLKFAEAMAAGRPVVSTENGATGVDVVDGREALIADAPEDFAAALVRLLNDPALAAQLGLAGRETARRSYDWRALGERYASVLERVVENSRKTTRALP